MYNEAILKLFKAGFNVYEIARSLGIDITDVRAALKHTNDSNDCARDFNVLQQILHEIHRDTNREVTAIRNAAKIAAAANIECQSLELLQQRVNELSKLESSQWTSKHTYELCAILKQLNTATNTETASLAADTRVVNVKFV